ncbi:flotillin-1-like [Panonychus citri]|uniref:flotillin-1-like n=1 Tax=Panonychus citri TaxID=50023 RepID=UPI0023082096|nr:flotillin-1-like [Panonychus citri]
MPGFITCGPNEALVVSGCCHSRPLMVAGGRVFVWPLIQQVQKLSLNTMTLTIESPRVYTQQGVPISVTGVAQVKIQGQNLDMLRSACEQFMGRSEQDIINVARETLEGHQRAIMASLTVEDIYKNRKRFSKKVFDVASSDLIDMGFTIVSYTIKDISDEEGYLKALGMARTAEVKRDARIGEAEAQRDSLIKEAEAEEEKMASKYLNDTEIAKAQKDFELKKAAYDNEVFTKKAESDLAFDIQSAKTKKYIKENQMEVLVVERNSEIEIQEQEIKRREKELEAIVKKPAEAEAYKVAKLAEAHKLKLIAEAEAEAQAIKLRGEAEAFAIEARAKAEAEQMAKKANAYKEYENAAKIDMILETLPRVAAEIAAPLAQCNKVTMIAQGDGPVGASKLTNEVLDMINKVHSTVNELATIAPQRSTTLSSRPTVPVR